jgi:hypothetical protein
VKDLKRTPTKASLCDLKKLQEWVRTVTTSYRGLITFPHAHGLCSCKLTTRNTRVGWIDLAQLPPKLNFFIQKNLASAAMAFAHSAQQC